MGYVDQGVKEGAKLVVDGRGLRLQGYENGNFMGGCLFDEVKPDMTIYKDEIFGPVLSVVRSKTFDDAVKLVNDHAYGNGTGDLHPRRRRRARLRQQRQDRHGRHQRADPGAGRLSQLRRLEGLGVRRPRHLRHGGRALLHQAQDRDRPLADRHPRGAPSSTFTGAVTLLVLPAGGG
jgi:malonate-semialdehyde dehydrogenase (acetylating)/methylmalonate-semialdehyde dehydrogenase